MCAVVRSDGELFRRGRAVGEAEEHLLGGVGHESFHRIPHEHLERGVAVAGLAAEVVAEEPFGSSGAERVGDPGGDLQE
jgi:hypothetical protein